MSTHAQFQPGKVEESYIQLWDQKLKLNALDTIDWKQSQADLIVLSACQTAIGDTTANGFAGLALSWRTFNRGTLWSVNDQSTTELVVSFYGHCRTAALKRRPCKMHRSLRFVNHRHQALLLTTGLDSA